MVSKWCSRALVHIKRYSTYFVRCAGVTKLIRSWRAIVSTVDIRDLSRASTRKLDETLPLFVVPHSHTLGAAEGAVRARESARRKRSHHHHHHHHHQQGAVASPVLVPPQERGLDYEQLLGAGPYKEEYRADMIRWGESRRQQDPGVFCRLAVSAVTRPVWVVSDCRRMSDLQWFWTEYPQQCVSVRVEASERTRALRGWRFTAGVDDAESECGLDQGVDFDWILTNNGDANLLDQQLEGLLSLIKAKTQDSRDGIHQRGE